MIAHVFVDAENISPAVTFKVVEYFGREHTITKVDIIAKEDTLPYKYRVLDGNLYRVQNCFYGKNSADTWLCIEMVRAIIDEPDLELIIIVSSDKDFLPAIKFAADFEKKILIVSNGAGHKTLAEQLEKLQVDKTAFELKDFRVDFGEVPTKIEKFLPQLSFYMKKYFFDREERIKLILVKQGAQLFEVPFVAGMNTSTFRQLLLELGILSKREPIKDFVTQNFLKLFRNKIYFRTEAEISVSTPAEQIELFFIEHADNVRKIFIKRNEKLFEVSFVDGMPLELFDKLLREKNIIGKSVSAKSVAKKSFLDVRDGKVFLCNEDRLNELVAETTGNLDNYFAQQLDAKKIFVKHNGNLFEIPFVDGMPFKLFERLLRNKKIIGKNSSAVKIATNSLLEVSNNRVYLLDENELEAAQDDLENNVDSYLNEHALEIDSVSIRYDGKKFSIPFVDGMPIKIFGKLLRERKIIDRKTLPEDVAASNSFVIRGEKIFRQRGGNLIENH